MIPRTAALSVNSPQSIRQAAAIGVPLAAGPAAPASDTARIAGRPTVGGGSVTVRLRATGPGTAYAYVWDGKVVGEKKAPIAGAGSYAVTVPGARGVLTVAFDASAGGTASSAVRLG